MKLNKPKFWCTPSFVSRLSLRGPIVNCIFYLETKAWTWATSFNEKLYHQATKIWIYDGLSKNTKKIWEIPQISKSETGRIALCGPGFESNLSRGRERDWSRLSPFSVERELRQCLAAAFKAVSCMERADWASSSSSDLISNIKPLVQLQRRRGDGIEGGWSCSLSRQTGGAGADWNIENWPDRGLTQH